MKMSNVQSRHICDFSKGVNPWFKLKNWNLTFVCFLLPIFSEGGRTSVIRLTHGLSWKIDTAWPHDYTNYTDLPRLPYYWLQSTTETTLTAFTTNTNSTDYIYFSHCTDYCTTPTTYTGYNHHKRLLTIQSSNTMRLIKLFLLIWLITPTTASTLNYTNCTDCIGYTDYSKVQIYIQFKNGDTWLCIFYDEAWFVFLHQLKSNNVVCVLIIKQEELKWDAI